MAKKKIVEIDEEMLKGIMVSDVPVFGRPSQATELPEIDPKPAELPVVEPTKKQRPQRNPYRRKKEESSEYRDRYLVNTPAPARVQTYINRESYARIRLIAPDVSIASYVNNILSEHLEKHWDEINDMYDQSLNQFNKPW